MPQEQTISEYLDSTKGGHHKIEAIGVAILCGVVLAFVTALQFMFDAPINWPN